MSLWDAEGSKQWKRVCVTLFNLVLFRCAVCNNDRRFPESKRLKTIQVSSGENRTYDFGATLNIKAGMMERWNDGTAESRNVGK